MPKFIRVQDEKKGEILVNLDHILEVVEDNSSDRPSLVLKGMWNGYRIRESQASFMKRTQAIP